MSRVRETDAKSNLVVKPKATAMERSGWLSNTCAIPPALRQGAIFVAEPSLAGALSYVYHVLMGCCMLGPAEYGAFSSVVAILTILSVSTSVVQTVIAHKLGFKLAGE